jgi:putative AlgH/UPF0301 family transcriptional regulator
MRAALIATAAALRSSLACAFVAPHAPTKLAALRSGEDDEEPAELTEDFRDFRARLIARTQGEGLEVGSDREAAGAGWAYETPLLEQGCVLLGGVEQEFGFGLRQQYFHKCVLLLTQYDDAFTRGVIVNRPSRREVDGWSLWCGGDVEEGGLFAAHKLGKPGAGRPPSIECLSTEELPGSESCRKVGNGLWTSSFGDAKAAVASGVAEKDDFVCICGYAGWAPKQLEGELERHSWYVAATDGATLVRELQDKQRGADGDIPLDDGLECWRSLMTNIGREASVATAAKKSAATNDFDDLMLRAWIDNKLDAPVMNADSFLEASRHQARKEQALGAVARDGSVIPGALLACQNVKGADFLLDKQFLHKSLVQIIAVQQDLVIGCVLNRPTKRRVSLRLDKGGERSKTVAFGGDVQVRTAAGGVVWLKRGPLAGDKGDRLPLGGDDASKATHVVSAKDVVDALANDAVDPDDVLAASGVVAFAKVDLERMLGNGHALPVPLPLAPLDAAWALHSDKGAPLLSPDDIWRASFDAATRAAADLPPPATPAELADTLADVALEKFCTTFLS